MEEAELPPPKIGVDEAWSRVMGDVQAIRKSRINEQQHFPFRGIDEVVNAVGPALRKHGVRVVPSDVAVVSTEQYESRNKALMTRVVLKISWTVTGPDGTSFPMVSLGEAADAGDKVIAKAHSVAYRIVLLEGLCVPTDEPDADEQTHERVIGAAPPQTSGRDWIAEGNAATDVEGIRALWRECSVLGELTEPIKAAFTARVAELSKPPSTNGSDSEMDKAMQALQEGLGATPLEPPS